MTRDPIFRLAFLAALIFFVLLTYLDIVKGASGDIYIGCDPPEEEICVPESEDDPGVIGAAEIEVTIDGIVEDPIRTIPNPDDEKLFSIVDDGSENGFFPLMNLTAQGFWPHYNVASDTISYRGRWACAYITRDLAWSEWTDAYIPSPEPATGLKIDIVINSDPISIEEWLSNDDFSAIWQIRPIAKELLSVSFVLTPLKAPIDGIVGLVDSTVVLINESWEGYEQSVALFQLSDDGRFRVSDNVTYRADSVLPYIINQEYLIRIDINIDQKISNHDGILGAAPSC